MSTALRLGFEYPHIGNSGKLALLPILRVLESVSEYSATVFRKSLVRKGIDNRYTPAFQNLYCPISAILGIFNGSEYPHTGKQCLERG